MYSFLFEVPNGIKKFSKQDCIDAVWTMSKVGYFGYENGQDIKANGATSGKECKKRMDTCKCFAEFEMTGWNKKTNSIKKWNSCMFKTG